MFSTVLFSVTLAPTAPQFAPLSLSTSFCGSMKTTAVSLFWNVMVGGSAAAALFARAATAMTAAPPISNCRREDKPLHSLLIVSLLH